MGRESGISWLHSLQLRLLISFYKPACHLSHRCLRRAVEEAAIFHLSLSAALAACRPTCRLPIRRDAQLDSPFVFLPPEHSLSLSTSSSYRACFSIMNFRRSCFLLDVRAGEKRKACCYCNLRLDLLSGGRIDGGPLYELCRCQEGVSPRVSPDPPHFRPRSKLQGGPRASIILLVIHGPGSG